MEYINLFVLFIQVDTYILNIGYTVILLWNTLFDADWFDIIICHCVWCWILFHVHVIKSTTVRRKFCKIWLMEVLSSSKNGFDRQRLQQCEISMWNQKKSDFKYFHLSMQQILKYRMHIFHPICDISLTLLGVSEKDGGLVPLEQLLLSMKYWQLCSYSELKIIEALDLWVRGHISHKLKMHYIIQKKFSCLHDNALK